MSGQRGYVLFFGFFFFFNFFNMGCACLRSIFERRGFIILPKPWGALWLIKGLLLERAVQSGRWLTISRMDLIGSVRRLIESAKLPQKVKLFLLIGAILCHVA